jgi:LAS superfamily LD-carboxypeptidase LdcB
MALVNGFTKVLIVITAVSAAASVRASIDINHLSKQDITQAEKLLTKLEPLIKEHRQNGTLATLTFDELYAPLSKSERAFLKSFQNLDAKKLGIKLPYRGVAAGKEEFVVIKGQKVKVNGQVEALPPQFLTKEVYQNYMAMMDAMQKDIGKRLYVESGYRSSAYQLYLFVFYLKKHGNSIRETAKFVALPGYSEHGDTEHQAVDFINENGINQDRPKEFESLPEYHWLLANAKKINFVLSYPKDANEGITFEPWHWRYEKDDSPKGK